MNLGFHDCDCSAGSGIKEFDSGFNIYPNPAQNENIYIKSSYPIREYYLYNSVGKIILQNNIYNLNEVSLKTTNLKSGIYFITIKNDFGRQTKPIFIE